MKAAVYKRYGRSDVISIEDVPKPAPDKGEVLVKIHASAVTRTDDATLQGNPFATRLFSGLFRPKIPTLGLDFAGVVEAIGDGVSAFKPDDAVFGLSPLGYRCHAEYICIPEEGPIVTLPEGVAFEEAVLCEGVWYANVFLRRFKLEPGHKILVHGGSGAIGSAAVQLAKSYGAEVTAVVSSQHLDLVKSLGADHAIDYTAGDFTETDERFDFILDAVGKTTYFRCRNLLKPRGVYTATEFGPWAQNIWLTLWSKITRSGRVIFPLPLTSNWVAAFEKQRMETGELRAVIDRVYPLEQIAEAFDYVATGHKTGIVVLRITPASGGEAGA